MEDIECEEGVRDIEPLTGDLLMAQNLYAQVREQLAKRKGHTFNNNALLGVSSFSVSRPDEASGRRRYARLGFRQVWYVDHIFLGQALRSDISDWFKGLIDRGELNDPTVLDRIKEFIARNPTFVPAQRLGVPTDLTLSDAPRWPMLPFRLGLAVVILTTDSRCIVPLRSSRVDLGDTEDRAYTASVGEGMVRGDTVQGLERLRLKMAQRRQDKVGDAMHEHEPPGNRQSQESEVPSLVALAARALRDEMGIRDQIDCDVGRDVLCVAVNFDCREAFPYLTTVLKGRHTFDHIMRNAADSWENEKVLGLPWDEQTAKALFTGEIELPGEGKIVAGSARERVFFGQAWATFGVGG